MDFQQRVKARSDVIMREVSGESVLLDLKSETYFGLDEVGTRMWNLVVSASCIEEAYRALLDEYDVEAHQLREDLIELIQMLVDENLVEISLSR